MIVNPSFALATGKGVGDTVELLTADGRAPYSIVAEGSDLLNAKVTTAYISQANLEADFGATEDVFLQLNLEPGADYVSALEVQAKAAFSAIYIVFAALAFPSLIAMLNTLTIGVLERTREIGMIRAVGGTRRQIQDMVVVEALLLAAIGRPSASWAGCTWVTFL